MAKERNLKGRKVSKREPLVPASFTCNADLLVLIDDKARSLDVNRSQYLRKLARRDLGLEAA